MMQNAAFQDLCFLAEATGPEAWRRKIVFEKDNGEAWQKLGTACMDEAWTKFASAQLLCKQINVQDVVLTLSPAIVFRDVKQSSYCDLVA